ncbi:hypothetical protein BH24GEM1_BH24GEM1_01020 [soil metagenome]
MAAIRHARQGTRLHRTRVKATRYFQEQVLRKRAYLRLDWIESVLRTPARRAIQPDGRIRHWGYIPASGRWIRVVTLEDGETDSLYIDLADRPSADSREVTPGVVLDFDAAGALVGIDIDRASVQLDLSGVDTGSVPVELVGTRSR